MKYLVTGGAGFIGSHIVDRLLADGHQVRILDNFSSGKPGNLPSDSKVEIIEGDVSHFDYFNLDIHAIAENTQHLTGVQVKRQPTTICYHAVNTTHGVVLTNEISGNRWRRLHRLTYRGPTAR